MDLKYVIYEVSSYNHAARKEAIIFARDVMHSEAYMGARSTYFSEHKEVRVLSAGFCQLGASKTGGCEMRAWGESTSLNVKSAKDDSEFLTNFLKEGAFFDTSDTK